MKLGAEDKKKVIALSALILVAGYLVYTNLLSDPAPSAPSAPGPAAQRSAEPDAAPASAPSAPAAASSAPVRRAGARNPKNDEFHPVFRARNSQGEAPIDAMTVDPTIHIDLLAKVQDAKMEGGQRNLFQFGAAPPPELKGPEPIVKPKPVARVYDYPRPFVPKPPAAQSQAVEPPPPPPSFKYYGLATRRINNQRTAFFLDGEDIILATEGMTVKGRWRLVRIGGESVTLEDTQTKRQQPMAISEEAGGTP
ncbi:MAG: hypothetical protein KGN36_06495 [Acidobacteriota bacterium]|nr:hypothetical protein [Acidobacteriota bacterium]